MGVRRFCAASVPSICLDTCSAAANPSGCPSLPPPPHRLQRRAPISATCPGGRLCCWAAWRAATWAWAERCCSPVRYLTGLSCNQAWHGLKLPPAAESSQHVTLPASPSAPPQLCLCSRPQLLRHCSDQPWPGQVHHRRHRLPLRAAAGAPAGGAGRRTHVSSAVPRCAALCLVASKRQELLGCWLLGSCLMASIAHSLAPNPASPLSSNPRDPSDHCVRLRAVHRQHRAAARRRVRGQGHRAAADQELVSCVGLSRH